MTEILTIDPAALDWTDASTAPLPALPEAGPELLGALLAHVVRKAAGAVTGSPLTPVSVTQDTTASATPGQPVIFTTGMDRRTRTLVFANGRAEQGGQVVMTLTGVFAITG
jgi:hypothetical protein